MNADILVYSPISDDSRRALAASFTLHIIAEAADRETFLAEHARQIRGIITEGPRPIAPP